MSARPRVTICVRTFERPSLLARAIGSALAQTFTDWELIVANNGGSPTEVDDVVADSAAGDPRVHVLHLDDPVEIGELAARAFEHGSGEFLGLLDDDDTWFPDYLSRMVAALDSADETVGGVACQVRRVWERLLPSGDIEFVDDESFNPNLMTLSFQSAFASHPISTNAFVFRRTAYDGVGGYDHSVATGEDALLLLNILRHFRVEVIPEELGARHERVDSDLGKNMIADELLIRDGDAVYRDKLTEEPMRRGEIEPTRVARSISVVDRENHRRVDEALNHLREIRLHAGDTLHDAEHSKAQLDGYDATFRAMSTLLAPVVWLRKTSGRLVRGKSGDDGA